MATEGPQNVLYQSVEIEAGIRIGDVGQPNILVSLVIGVNNRRRPRGTMYCGPPCNSHKCHGDYYLETPFMCQFVSECQCQTAMRSEFL